MKSKTVRLRKQSESPHGKTTPQVSSGSVGMKDQSMPVAMSKNVPVQKIIGTLLSTLGLGGKSDDKAVQKVLPAFVAPAALGAIGGSLLGLQDDEKSVQKILPAWVAPAALGAIGGKLLGLSKKEGVPVQKIIPGLGAAMEGVGQAVRGVGTATGAVGDVASGAASGVASGIGQTAGAIGDVAGAAGKKVAGAINPTKSQLNKHRTKRLHSHKRNPFRRK